MEYRVTKISAEYEVIRVGNITIVNNLDFLKNFYSKQKDIAGSKIYFSQLYLAQRVMNYASGRPKYLMLKECRVKLQELERRK